MQELQINEKALLRLYAPWEEPSRHRQGSEIAEGRRLSQLTIPNSLREHVKVWRESDYEGSSETSRALLTHWFGGGHLLDDREFRYYFCQREAIETLVFLYEVQQNRRVSDLISEYDTTLEALVAAAGMDPIENAWPKYAFKLATGTGKTKCMSLAIVWSYFHALYEPNSEMTTRFLVIAPGLTVYERLLEDFGGGKIFHTDPLIPPAWKKDWHLDVIQQNEPGGVSEGVLYLTNIQKLYPKRQPRLNQYYSFMGPPARPTKSIDIGAELRERISKESRLMILNDEAHHVWHPKLAWNQALQFFNEKCDSVVAQLDFSATPRDQGAKAFDHIVCDTPLGEAVDAGIVKVPIMGYAELREAPSENAAERYREHLNIGYERWRKSFEEWQGVGEKALLFVMCENIQSANAIAEVLNTDPFFEDLNQKTLNLHTKLKGKIEDGEFIEEERNISPTDLKQLRELSRTLDSKDNPYNCIVSVLMLREGWDVKNVTTIVPLRPFTADAQILPEQTLGRGLRRMRHPATDEVIETVVVIEHPSFIRLYEEVLGNEGVTPIVQPASDIKSTNRHIYPVKNGELEIELPHISRAHSINLVGLQSINWQDVEERCAEIPKLSLDTASSVKYKGIHMLTQEVVEVMEFDVLLLNNGSTAIGYFVKLIGQECRLRLTSMLHLFIAPLIEQFLTEMLFEEKVELTDPRLIRRLPDGDVSAAILTVFVPLVLDRMTRTVERRSFKSTPVRLSEWKPYPFPESKQNPVIPANKTMFNLVPCHRHFEKEFAEWLDRAEDVVAFAKNAGPEALEIDYLDMKGRIARYIPDFFVHNSNGDYFLVETKGFPDLNVKQKALAGHSWCKSATEASDVSWTYLFVHQTEWNFSGVRSLAELIPIATRMPS